MYVNTIYIQILIIYTICIYNYIYNAYTHIHICIYIYLHIRIHTYIHVYLYVYILSICIQIHTHTHIYIYICIHIYIYIYTCAEWYVVYIYIYIYNTQNYWTTPFKYIRYTYTLHHPIPFHFVPSPGLGRYFGHLSPMDFRLFPHWPSFSPYVNGKERHVYPMVHQNFPNEKICKLDYFMGHDFAANHVVHRFRFLIKWPFRLGILYDLYDIPLSIVCCQMPLHSPNNVKTNGLLTRVARTHYR